VKVFENSTTTNGGKTFKTVSKILEILDQNTHRNTLSTINNINNKKITEKCKLKLEKEKMKKKPITQK